MSFLLQCLLTLITGFITWKTYKYFSAFLHKRLLASKLPGPKGNPIFGMVVELSKKDGFDLAEWLLEQSEICRSQGHDIMCFNLLGDTYTIPISGKGVQYIVNSHDEITKGVGYDFSLPWLGLGLLLSTGEKWHSRRKLLTPTFHFKQLEGYVETFNAQSKIFVDFLAKEKSDFDALPFIKRCALDSICETAMGVTVDAQQNPSHQYVVAVRDFLWLATEYSTRAQNWFPPYWYLSGRAALYRKSLKVLLDFTKKVISERKEQRNNGEVTTKRTNFLDMLLEMKDAGNFNDEDIREEVDTFMFEGHDTTSSAVGWTLWCIAHHKDVQEKLRKKIDEVVGIDSEDITTSHLQQMTYLDRVVKESSRLYAPVPMVNRRLQNDFQNGPYLLPKGAITTITPIIIHRNKEVWGDDCLKFNPERFLPENMEGKHAFDYIPFSAGPRNCVGQKFALYETKIMVSWVVRTFEISSNTKFEDNRVGIEAILRPEKGIPLKLKKRK